MRIAITGGLGRLGQYVVRALADHAPRVIDILAPAAAEPVLGRALPDPGGRLPPGRRARP